MAASPTRSRSISTGSRARCSKTRIARNLCGIEQANSTEFGPTPEPVVGLMTEWLRGNELEKRSKAGDLGGTMRLGAYPAMLRRGGGGGEGYGGGGGTFR